MNRNRPHSQVVDKEVTSLHREAERFVLDFIRQTHPEWVREDGSCPKCLAYYERLDEAVSVVDATASRPHGRKAPGGRTHWVSSLGYPCISLLG